MRITVQISFTLTFLFFLGLPIQLLSQEILQYKGPLEVNGYRGNATYTYKIIDQDTILDGPFKMNRSNLATLLEKEDSSFSLSGEFKDNYPTNLWKFQFGTYNIGSQSEVIDYQYRILVNGSQEEAEGSFFEGKPHGTWNYSVDKIKDSELEKNLFKSKIEFEKGVPIGSFRIENEENSLVGRFLRNGYAHDEWSLYSDDELGASENWFFENGVLLKIETSKNGALTSSALPWDSNSDTKTINLDTRYLEALQLQQISNDSTNLLQGNLAKMLGQNLGYYKKIDSILSKLGKSEFKPNFKVKVPYYPLDAGEATLLDSIQINLNKALAKSDLLLKNTQLNILKRSDVNALYQYLVVHKLATDFVQPIAKVIKYQKEGILEFARREYLFENIWSNQKPSKELQLKSDGELALEQNTFRLENAENYDFNGSSIQTISNIIAYANNAITRIANELEDKLFKEKSQQELASLEEKLIAGNEKLDSLSTNYQNETIADIVSALNKIKSFSDDHLTSYTALKDEELKLKTAKKLVLCFNELDSLSQQIIHLPKYQQEIDSLYLDRVWNPFMATVMDEQIKKRITSAYSKTLAPYFLKIIENDLTCERAPELKQKIEQVQLRIKALRDEDTRKLERKLKRERNPEEIIKLLFSKSTEKGILK